MPQLSNIRHETFARFVAEGNSQTKSYIYAGYSENGARANAARLIANDSIRQRILELSNEIRIENETDQKNAVVGIFNDLEEIIISASSIGKYDAVYRAIALKAKIKGLV